MGHNIGGLFTLGLKCVLWSFDLNGKGFLKLSFTFKLLFWLPAPLYFFESWALLMFSLPVLLFPLRMIWTITRAISVFFGLVVLFFLFVAIIAWTVRVRAWALWTRWRTLGARCLWVRLFFQRLCCNFWSSFRSLCNPWWKKVAFWSCGNYCIRCDDFFERNLLRNRSRFL